MSLVAAAGIAATANTIFKLTAGTVMAALGLKAYWKLSLNRCDSYTCLSDKTAIITGANGGMGLIIAKELAKRGARLIIACREKDKGESALCSIVEETGNCDIVLKSIDVASYESVRAFAKDINETEKRVDILINNAGVYSHDNDTLRINYTSVFLLTHLLMDKLKESAPSRIVTTASLAGKFIISINPGELEALDKNAGRDWLGYVFVPYAYRVAKCCVIYFTTELARKIEGTGVTINTLHPGVVQTQLFKGSHGANWVAFDSFISRQLMVTPEEGAQTAMYLAVSKELENVSGAMFSNCKRHEVYRSARNRETARKIWEVTEKIVGLKEEEKIRKK